jgi:hypothetical protein
MKIMYIKESDKSINILNRTNRSTSSNAHKNLVGKPEGTTPRGTPRSRWEDNIKTGIKERENANLDCIHLAQNRAMDFCEHGNETSGSIKAGDLFTSSATIRFSRTLSTL